MSSVPSTSDSVERELARIERELFRKEKEIELLRAQREILLRVRRNSTGDEQQTLVEFGDAHIVPAEFFQGLQAGDAVDALLGEEPGMTQKQIVDRLEKVVDSTAKDVRVVLNATIKRKIAQGQINKKASGRLYPKDPTLTGDLVTSADLAEGRISRQEN